jgi:nucleotide-binding universal stress UspA family protein
VGPSRENARARLALAACFEKVSRVTASARQRGGEAERGTEQDSLPPPSGVQPRGATGPYIVLVGLDLSEPGGRAWRYAFDLAARRGETEIHAVVLGARRLAPRFPDVSTPGARVTPSDDDAPDSDAPLKVLQHRSAGGQARLMALHFRAGRADREIVRLAEEIGADLIVVASHPPTALERLFGGSTADRIARRASCPVVLVKAKSDADDPGRIEYAPGRD